MCIDLYFYEGATYLTLIDVFSNFPYCVKVDSKGAVHVKIGFDKFCATYAIPEMILSDNGGEFVLIPNRDTTPSERPQANEKIEWFHQEMESYPEFILFLQMKEFYFCSLILKKRPFFNGLNFELLLSLWI